MLRLIPLGYVRRDTSGAKEQHFEPSPWDGLEWAAITENQQSNHDPHLVVIRPTTRYTVKTHPVYIGEIPRSINWTMEGVENKRPLVHEITWLGEAGLLHREEITLYTDNANQAGVSAWDVTPPKFPLVRLETPPVPPFHTPFEIWLCSRTLCYDASLSAVVDVSRNGRIKTAVLMQDLDELPRQLPGWQVDAEKRVVWRPTSHGFDEISIPDEIAIEPSDEEVTIGLFALANEIEAS